MKRITKATLDSIKIRVEKLFAYSKPDVVLQDYEDMRAGILFLLKENVFLKERLFDLSNALPEEQQLHNILASKLELAFFEHDAKEFLEINNSINNQTYTIIIQKKFGKTPKQLLDLSEIRRLKVINKNISLQKHVKTLQDTCTTYSHEVSALKHITGPFKSDDEVQISRKAVEHAQHHAKGLASGFNSSFVKYEATKLHKSFLDAFQEAWRRAYDAESKRAALTKEIKQLKKVILKKKYPRCRIYKGRLKRD